mgnify:FL=1
MAGGGHQRPVFRLEDYFAGRTRAWGIFQDRFGTLRQQFEVTVDGTWEPEKRQLTLVEDFVYSTGATERRIWYVTKTGDTHYEGRTKGIVGRAHIRALPDAVHLRYRLQVPIGGRSWTLAFDDRMYRQDDRVMINRAIVRKWGFLLGTATICFQKESAETGGAAAPEKAAEAGAAS